MSFDIILIDIILPKITGIEIIRRLQEESQIRPAVIFITGEPNLETAIQAIKLGAYDYLEKPVSKENLIQSIQQAITRITQYRNYISSKDSLKLTQLEAPILPKLLEIPLKSYSNSIEEIWNALAELKKKYREALNDDQRNILNTIVKNITLMRDAVKKESV
jgi:DNA-binding response OmpR family regulator